MNLDSHIRSHFEESHRAASAAWPRRSPPQIARAGEALAQALKADRKVLACGNGGSAADSQHFAAEIVGASKASVPGMPAIALTVDTPRSPRSPTITRTTWFFSKQVESLGAPAISSSASRLPGTRRTSSKPSRPHTARGCASSPSPAATAVPWRRCSSPTISTSTSPTSRTMRIQEVHLLAIHCLCEGVDNEIFGEKK
jgi:D-sedoheptulose 7-phosphate isomerase